MKNQLKNINSTFYGTGAAEGIPNPFCGCFLCENARANKGKDIRTRSMFRIDNETAIDISADSFVQALKYGDFKQLKNIIITHTHDDHFNSMMISLKGMSTTNTEEPLTFYLTDKAYEMVDILCNSSTLLKGRTSQLIEKGVVQFKKLEFYKKTRIGRYNVIPLKGNHTGNLGETCANYLIQMEDGKWLYYAVDTGYFLDETFEFLKNYSLDTLIIECSYGLGEDTYPNPGHLSLRTCMMVLENLKMNHSIQNKTKIYLTHINHCHTGTHSLLEEAVKNKNFSSNITVAYDGMTIE